nr:hypothetical protein [Tanacetum cinerariifolium]GEX69184.1 hypothetical protein [Tanacetum cinerariifolium]
MESSLSFFALFSLIMIANVIDARPNPGEYKPDSLPTKKTYENSDGLKAEKFDKEFEPRPNISTYDNGASLNGKKTSQGEFEPRPNVSVYDNGVGLNGKKTVENEFEPRPNISVYNG